LLLTDFFWNRKGVLENARLYVLMTILGMAGIWYVWTVLGAAGSVGSTSTGISSAEYFLTQCRVIWTYIRLFFFPVGQNLDHDVAISRSLLDPVALVGLMALIALVVSAWFARNRWPLASFGVFVFLLLIAPTSSFVPIADVMAEHRLYLPFFGLALVCLEFLRLATVLHAVVTAVVVLGVCAMLTFERNQVWASPLSLWHDAVEKSPNKVRPRFQLAFAYYDLGRCAEAAEQYEKASLLGPPDHGLLVDWALALDCMGRAGDALTRLGQAAAIERTAHVYSLIGMIHGKQGHVQLALEALAEAERMDPRYEMTYVYRGNVFEAGGDLAAAAREYEHAVGLNSSNVIARQALLRVSQ
jgi:Flp pilus assembly protein TadD